MNNIYLPHKTFLVSSSLKNTVNQPNSCCAYLSPWGPTLTFLENFWLRFVMFYIEVIQHPSPPSSGVVYTWFAKIVYSLYLSYESEVSSVENCTKLEFVKMDGNEWMMRRESPGVPRPRHDKFSRILNLLLIISTRLLRGGGTVQHYTQVQHTSL